MTTINVSTPTVQSSSGGGKAPAGNDISAQIAQVTQKITKLTQQLKDIVAALSRSANSRNLFRHKSKCYKHSWLNCCDGRPRSHSKSKAPIREKLRASTRFPTNIRSIFISDTTDHGHDRRLIHWPAYAPRPTAPEPRLIKSGFYVEPASVAVQLPASGA